MQQSQTSHLQPSFHQEQTDYIRVMLPPPNPIMTKNVHSINERANFRIDYIKQSISSSEGKFKDKRELNQSQSISQQSKKKQYNNNQQDSDELSLINGYDKSTLIFQKYDNQRCNKRGAVRYMASIFLGLQGGRATKLPEYKGMMKDDQLIFDSNFQSSNLMAVFKTGENTYDLLLQNDVNTGCFTQWFNFRVQNKRHNFIAKFNIVNLYKSKSLYNMGMKPIVHSQKSDKNNKKTWRRRGFNIYYQKNDLNYEDDPTKYYKTLSFQYDFTIENDRVNFAHAIPYDLNDLQKVLDTIKINPKVSIRYVGLTLMGKQIPIIKIKAVQPDKIQKKAIVIMARQHPGQTPGSYIAEEVIYELLRHSTQVDFLIWRFDIYIFPMVNMDGVALGNYRGNFAGYDLNRCWQKTDSNKQPQVYAIKNYIKKLSKKQHIELILDLHGHSRKMGSFFYGNNFGKNSMLFPFIASKANPNIKFQNCKFSVQKAAKASTARVVLGNLIKETGNVYTYEVTFFGNYKNDNVTPFAFNEEHYKQLGKTLILAMYRTYMEIYKEEKTLKESLFLKNIKKELLEVKANKIQQEEESESGSDDEAQVAMEIQKQQLDSFFEIELSKQSFVNLSRNQEEDQTVVIKKPLPKQYRLPVEKHNDDIKRKISELLQKNANQDGKGLHKLPSIFESKDGKIQNEQSHNKYDQFSIDAIKKRRHHYNANKLKIYGQTFQLKSRFGGNGDTIQNEEKDNKFQKNFNKMKEELLVNSQNRSKEVLKAKKQLIKSFNTINMNECRLQESKQVSFTGPKMSKKGKQRNNSVTLKEVVPIFNDKMVNDAVKINKLDFQKFKQHQGTSKRLIEQMTKGFKLPII